MKPAKPFLTAEWRHLAMLNFPIERSVLAPLAPAGTEVDTFQDQANVSVVGFLFLDTKIAGVPIPFHGTFEEVNLRFYVRRRAGDEWRRGVVFIKEIVPSAAIATVARVAYNENYVALAMRHSLERAPDNSLTSATYSWRLGRRWNHLQVIPQGEPRLPAPGSLAEFITEHYWGYAAQKDSGTLEYRVEHPQWTVRPANEYVFDCDVAALYGEKFVACLSRPPTSAFLADGSTVTVFKGTAIG